MHGFPSNLLSNKVELFRWKFAESELKSRQTPAIDDFDDCLVVPDTIPNIGPLVAVDQNVLQRLCERYDQYDNVTDRS